jgi:hypothetical protein
VPWLVVLLASLALAFSALKQAMCRLSNSLATALISVRADSGKLLLQSLDYKNPERKDFWDALMVVAEAELKEARKQDDIDRARLRGMREPDQDTREDTAVQAAVDMDVQIFLTGEPSFPGRARGAEDMCRRY